MKEMEVNGLDTMMDLSTPMPKRIELDHHLVENQELVKRGWNMRCVGIVLYCIKCKVPLVWHTYPEGENLFHCPKCHTRWVKGEGWSSHQSTAETSEDG